MERYYSNPSLAVDPLTGQTNIRGIEEERKAQRLLSQERKSTFDATKISQSNPLPFNQTKDNSNQNTSGQNILSGREEEVSTSKSIRQRQLNKKVLQSKLVQAEYESQILSGGKMKLKTASIFFSAWISATTGIGIIWLLIWANIHAFCLMVVGPRVFCRFGEEWFLGSPARTALVAQLKSPITGPALEETLKSKIKKFGFGEKVLLIFIDAIILIQILFALLIVISIIALMNPLVMGELIIDSFWDSLKIFFSNI